MRRDYHKPTLRPVSGKKNYYVFVTKPEALRRNPKDKQVRKSTGTSDMRIAEKLVHSIAEEIYREYIVKQALVLTATLLKATLRTSLYSAMILSIQMAYLVRLTLRLEKA